MAVDAGELEEVHRKEAADFFAQNLPAGADDAHVSDLIKRAYFKWPVYSIEVDSADRVEWVVRVRPRQVVGVIAFRKSKAVGRGDILERLNIRPGDRVTPEDLSALEAQLVEYYAYRGFPRATAKATLGKSRGGDGYRLVFAVTEGPECKLSAIRVRQTDAAGASVDRTDDFDARPGDRCDAQAILRSAAAIERDLRDDGYLSTESSKPALTYDADKMAAKLDLDIRSGPRIDVRFRGNTLAFERDSKLRRAIGYDDETEFNASWIEFRAREGIRGFYRAAGYPKVEVDVRDDWARDKSRRSITFTVRRGPKFLVGQVVFEGNEGFDDERLRREFGSAYAPEAGRRVFVEGDAADAVDGLLNFYQERGYLRAVVDPPVIAYRADRTVRLSYRVSEGAPSTLLDYQLGGNAVFTNAEVSRALRARPGDPINPVALRRNADVLEEDYRRKGYKFAKVRLPKIEEIPSGAVTYPVAIEEGAQVRFGEVSVRGNATTQEKVVRRELQFESGELYHPQKLRDSRRRLLQLGFFEGVSLDELPVDPAAGTEDVVVKVSERKKRSLLFRPGYSTDDGVRAATEFRYVNLFGTGRNFNSYARVNRRFDTDDNILERRIVLSYLEPYLIDKINGKVTFVQERIDEQQFDLDRTSFSLGLERQFQTWLRASTAWELEFRSPFNEQDGATLNPIDQARARFGSIQTQLDLDLRDDLLNPIEGTFHRVQVDVYNKGLLSDADFYQVYLRNNFYVPLYKRLRTVLSVRLGFSGTYGQTQEEQIPIEKRFRIGGNASFRGAGYNCIGGITDGSPENCSDAVSSQAPGGNALFNYMFDFLIPITGDLDLALFTDGGNAFLADKDFNVFDIRNSAGMGFRYNTFFGPMRFDYGILLDRRSGEKFGAFHFAVGQF